MQFKIYPMPGGERPLASNASVASFLLRAPMLQGQFNAFNFGSANASFIGCGRGLIDGAGIFRVALVRSEVALATSWILCDL